MTSRFPYAAWSLGRAGRARQITVIAHANESKGWIYPVAQTDDGEYLRLSEIYPTRNAALEKALANLIAAEARHTRQAESLARRRESIQKELGLTGEK